MSVASPAQSQVRRNTAAAPSQSPQHAAQAPVRPRAPQAFSFSASKGEDEIRLNLSDIPRTRATVDVEVFSPSLLSRLLDMIAPLNKR